MSRKTGKEAKVERITWFAMILVFMLLRFDSDVSSVPDYLVPIVIALILLVSGVYQYSQNWRVSPFTWIFFGILLFIGIFDGLYGIPLVDLVLVSLVIVVIIILMGVLTNEG